MKMTKGMEQHEVIERGVDALYKELGPAEARRFISLTHPHNREDSVIRHRRWQASLNKDDFFKEMREAQVKAGKKMRIKRGLAAPFFFENAMAAVWIKNRY